MSSRLPKAMTPNTSSDNGTPSALVMACARWTKSRITWGLVSPRASSLKSAFLMPSTG
ncbi:MAG: hypothetical protein U0235_33755 [Polyangiaceae bacterium]